MSQGRSDHLPFLHPLARPLDSLPRTVTAKASQNPSNSQWPSRQSPKRPSHVRVPPDSGAGKMNNSNSDSPLSRQRHKWFATEMRKNRKAFTNDKELRLFTGTWNVNGRPPEPDAELGKWLFPSSKEDPRPFDVYMLGLQEVQPLAGVDAVRTDITRGMQWRKRIHLALGADYEQIAEKQLVGVMVLVFLRTNHIGYLSDVQLSYAATGFLNAGNKGGVAARFQLYDQTIACVACHLAAHTENVDRRNNDFRDVVRKAAFEPLSTENSLLTPVAGARDNSVVSQPAPRRYHSLGDAISKTMSSSSLPPVAAGPGAWLSSVASSAATVFSDISAGANTAVLNDPNSLRILDHDVVFWLGDLNYRVDAPLEDVLGWVAEKNWDALHRKDQLQAQMKTCDAFSGFEEGKILFAPTYKLERHNDKYAVDENGEIKRVPAYTDRILWRVYDDATRRTSHLKQQDYNSARVYSSDHRPVYSVFRMSFGVEDVSKRLSVERKINKELDHREATFRPSLQISSSYVEFGDVFYERECRRRVSIRNQGAVTAFVTVNMPPDVPKWLIFDATKWRNVEVPPGKSVSLSLSVRVSGKDGSANALCLKGCVLSIDLGVSAEPGTLKETIQVRGRYVATTLGLSLEMLSMLSEPVLSLRSQRYKGKEHRFLQHPRDFENEYRNSPSIVPLSVPKELWLLVDCLLRVREGDRDKYLNQLPGIFLREADDAETQRALAFIDRAEAIPSDVNGYAVAKCMLNVLTNLEDAVIPRFAHRRAIEAGHTEDPDMVQAVVDMLPPLNANVFWYIIGFLCETPLVAGNDGRGDNRELEVAEVFGRILLSGGDVNPRDDRHRTAFVMGAIRHQQRTQEPAYRASIDLAHPSTHPRRFDSEVIG